MQIKDPPFSLTIITVMKLMFLKIVFLRTPVKALDMWLHMVFLATMCGSKEQSASRTEASNLNICVFTLDELLEFGQVSHSQFLISYSCFGHFILILVEIIISGSVRSLKILL